MLIVSNGAFKSGSTWLFNILKCMTGFPPPPSAYLHPDWVNPSIPREQLDEFLNQVDYANHNYILKSHFSKPEDRKALLAHPHVYILNIKRDLRDVAVSAYYHDCRKRDFQGSFADHYWQAGKFQINRVRKYHQLWDKPSPQIYVSSYEQLHENFAAEVRRIAAFLNWTLSDEDIQRIQAETSIDSLREKYGEADQEDELKFFRKGVVGDWQNHFDEAIAEDIAKIEADGISKPALLLQKIKNSTEPPEAGSSSQTFVNKVSSWFGGSSRS